MNIFCDRHINKWKGIKQLLQVDDLGDLTLGYQPGVALGNGGKDKTEVDLFIKTKDKKIFCESKLTETDFVFVKPEKVKTHILFYKIYSTERTSNS